MSDIEDRWPIEAQREVKRLRAESAKHRLERNDTRQQLADLRAEVECRPEGLLTIRQTLDAIQRHRRR